MASWRYTAAILAAVGLCLSPAAHARHHRSPPTLPSIAPTLPSIAQWHDLPPVSRGIGGYKFVASVDTMKLSKDQAQYGYTANDSQAVDLASTMAVTHITVNTPMEYPAVLEAYANRIHADGKSVWFRLSSTNGANLAHGDLGDGYPTYAPGYLTELHELMLAHPGIFRPGDILDGDAEAETSGWWAKQYGCGVQSAGCTASVTAFNHFLTLMTEQEKIDLGSLACATATSVGCVVTQVHSTDNGTGRYQLSNSTVEAMGDLITVDAYPDEGTTEPLAAAGAWHQELEALKSFWAAKGIPNLTVLVGEWGYRNHHEVTDTLQQEVVYAEVTKAFPGLPYVAGMNYWGGPGFNIGGGYTQLFNQVEGVWRFRPAAPIVSAFYLEMNRSHIL